MEPFIFKGELNKPTCRQQLWKRTCERLECILDMSQVAYGDDVLFDIKTECELLNNKPSDIVIENIQGDLQKVTFTVSGGSPYYVHRIRVIMHSTSTSIYCKNCLVRVEP